MSEGLETFPKYLRNSQAKNNDKKGVYFQKIYGNRFIAGQNLYEYLIEFLLIFTSKKKSENGAYKFHDLDDEEVLSFQAQPRMGLKRFILLDENNLEASEIDRIAYKELIVALKDKMDGETEDEKTQLLLAIQDLFRGYSAIIQKRLWCAQAMLPVCPEIIFTEAMPNRNDRDKLINNSLDGKKHIGVMKDLAANGEKKGINIDKEFAFDKRNFLGRGGEVYYLHLLQGLQNEPEKRGILEKLLKNLICDQSERLSQLASFIQKTWEDYIGYEKPLTQSLNLAFIPANAYISISHYSIDELINYLSCDMPQIKKIELLSKGIMIQVLRMLCVATTTYLGKDREYAWIMNFDGEDIVKNIAINNFNDLESLFESAIAKVVLDDGDAEKRRKTIHDIYSDSFVTFKNRGKDLNMIIPRTGAHEYFTLSEDILRFLVLAIVPPKESMTVEEFLVELYDRYRIVIGPEQYRIFDQKTMQASCFNENLQLFIHLLKLTGLLHELSDATSLVCNPYENIGEAK